MFEMDREALKYGVTAVENCFLLDYLPTAKGDFVKVYLYGLMQARNGQPMDLQELSHTLFMTVSEVEAALRYWERRALVSKLQENPPLYRFYSPIERSLHRGTPLEAESQFVSFSENVYALFEERRKITPAEIALAWEWVEDIGLTQEVVLMLLAHCINQRGASFFLKKAEPLAVRMKEENILTCDDADQFLRHEQQVHDGAKKVLSRMGKRRTPSEDELALYQKWMKEWGFDQTAILDACRETTKGDPSFKYLDGILNGIRTRSAARTGAQVQQQLQQESAMKDKYAQVFDFFAFKPSLPVKRNLYDTWISTLPHEVLVLAAREFNRSKGGTIEDFEHMLDKWRQLGLESETQVNQYLSRMRESNTLLRSVFETCGHPGRPMEKDRQLLQKWRQMNMNDALILQAATQARMATGNKMAYLDKVLEAWHKAGMTDISQARPMAAAPARQKTVSAQNYTQRTYTEEQLAQVSLDLIEEVKRSRG